MIYKKIVQLNLFLTVQALQIVSPLAVGFIFLAFSTADNFHILDFVIFEFFVKIVALGIVTHENGSILGKGFCRQNGD